jgi:hypothetical protein
LSGVHGLAEQVCNARVHAETGQTPIERFSSAGPPRAFEPSLLREVFRWSVLWRVTNTASVVPIIGAAVRHIRVRAPHKVAGTQFLIKPA